ncbi:unnamed protein product [Alopecurus aequalis]
MPSTTCAHVDTAATREDEDGLRGLPDDVLLDVLQRLVNAGDVYTAARTCILSRRWRYLPRYQVPHVSLDVGDLFLAAGWCRIGPPARGNRRKDWYLPYQHNASERLVQALWHYLGAPPSARVIETLKLKMILTKYELLRRVGRLVGEAVRSGRVKAGGAVELELLTEKRDLCGTWDATAELMLGYGARFTELVRGCPRAFRALTKLSVENLRFHNAGAVTDLVHHCRALEFLSMRFCGFVPPGTVMVVDSPPESRLRTLLCLECNVPGITVVQAPKLVEFHCGWRVLLEDNEGEQPPPASFGWTPELKKLTLQYEQYEQEYGDAYHEAWSLSDFLMLPRRQLQLLTLSFEATKIWVKPGSPTYLRAALGGLKELRLEKIHPTCDLSWAIFLLRAAPLLETLHIEIFNHACRPNWHQKLYTQPDTTAVLLPGFRHRGLKEVTIRRAFHVPKDVPFAKAILKAAVNLRKLTLGVQELGCEECTVALKRWPALARSRLRFAGASKDANFLVEILKSGIPTSAQIEVL